MAGKVERLDRADLRILDQLQQDATLPLTSMPSYAE